MAPYTIRWGILATGWIAEQFVKDLHVDPAVRDASDVAHKVVAAASARSAEQATKFLKEFDCPGAKGYGSYEELAKDPDVDVVYVATPHSHHYQNVMLCLSHGKHVLCEKSFTVNAAQTEKLAATAREKKLFLMEAVWTRYFPLSIQVRKIISEGKLGAVYRAFADLSLGEDVEKKFGTEHRMVKMDLAGGALLDLGIYSLTWLFQTLYHTLPPAQRKPPTVASSISKYSATGADESTSIILTFPSGPGGAPYAHGIATTSMRVSSDPAGTGSACPAIRIQGTKGELQVYHPAYCPSKYRLVWKAEGEGKEGKVEEHEVSMPGGGMGFMYEADEVARCVRDGKLESETLDLEESAVIMRVMDEVRKQGGLEYPEKLETLEWPIKHW